MSWLSKILCQNYFHKLNPEVQIQVQNLAMQWDEYHRRQEMLGDSSVTDRYDQNYNEDISREFKYLQKMMQESMSAFAYLNKKYNFTELENKKE